MTIQITLLSLFGLLTAALIAFAVVGVVSLFQLQPVHVSVFLPSTGSTLLLVDWRKNEKPRFELCSEAGSALMTIRALSTLDRSVLIEELAGEISNLATAKAIVLAFEDWMHRASTLEKGALQQPEKDPEEPPATGSEAYALEGVLELRVWYHKGNPLIRYESIYPGNFTEAWAKMSPTGQVNLKRWAGEIKDSILRSHMLRYIAKAEEAAQYV